MTIDASRNAFIARQAAFLQQRGADADTARAKLGAAFGTNDVAALSGQLGGGVGSFRSAFVRIGRALGVAPDELGLRALALEQAVAGAYVGLWRGMLGFGHYALGLAAIATLAFQVLVIFVVPQFVQVLGTGIHPFSHLVFQAGLGTALLFLLWLFVAWVFFSVFTARRAILLRSWPTLFVRIGLLRGAVVRHRVLLHAWSAGALLDSGVAPGAALDGARDAVADWTRIDGERLDAESGRELLDGAAAAGTLRDELQHRVANELADAPLALAARRERLTLYAGIGTALLVVPLLVAMYLMFFRIAATV